MEYLPLGSVITTQDSVYPKLIISRGIIINVNGEKRKIDYGACNYPEGLSEGKMMYFNSSAIDEILFRGCIDGI